MQRVLSFQMARSFGETSEFVTKRMCFSFLFSVGFLCLLCGFLLGRFAAESTMEFRAEKKRLEAAGNGLQSTEYLQHLLLQELEKASMDRDPVNGETFYLDDESVISQAHGVLANLSFVHRVNDYKSYVTAIVRGSREADRYVVLSVSGEGIGITLELVKILNKFHEEHFWNPRRTLVFCVFFGSMDPCPEMFSVFGRRKIVAYIAVHSNALQGTGHFSVSGSDIIQTIVLQTASIVQNLYSYNDQLLPSNVTYNGIGSSNVDLDIPHAVLSFVEDDITHTSNKTGHGLNKLILSQILSQAVWRLSECLIIRWDPSYLNETIFKALKSIDNTQFSESKEKIQESLLNLLINVKTLNEKIDATEGTNTLAVRILNDILMDLDRALLCPDNNLRSRTNWVELFKLPHEPSNLIGMYLNEMVKCYDTAVQTFQDL